MKHTSLLSLLTLILVLGALPALAERNADTSIEGTLLTSGCYLVNNTWGKDHKECAARCSQRGVPAGVLTAEGNFVPLMLPATKVADFMEETVRATGEMKAGLLLVSKLEVKNGATWQEIDVGL
jgi:hypothetical protein